MIGYRPIKAQAVRHGQVQGQAVQTLRTLAEEVPVALVYNGTTQAVMMATPCNLDDFGRGFTRTEGLGEVERIEVITHTTGIEVQMWLPEAQADALATRRRAMTGPVGCGLCGIDSLDQAVRSLPVVSGGIMLSPQDVGCAMAAMRDGQIMHTQTRAMHAAGFYVPSRGLTCLREDVGRHNALDKLVGAVPDCSIGAVLLTSRVSVDMVQKTALAGASVILAVSAPTTLAVQAAQTAGITLAALVCGDTFEVFTHPHRILPKIVPKIVPGDATDVA